MNVEKLAEEVYGKGVNHDYEEGFVDGYNKAKETLYTELPSDEEIEKKSNLLYLTKKIAGYMSEKDFVIYARNESFKLGSKWMKEQILNQNK